MVRCTINRNKSDCSIGIDIVLAMMDQSTNRSWATKLIQSDPIQAWLIVYHIAIEGTNQEVANLMSLEGLQIWRQRRMNYPNAVTLMLLRRVLHGEVE
jgi:hypothetical protein